MRYAIAVTFNLIVFFTMAAISAVAAAQAPNSAKPCFVICAAEEDTEFGSALLRVLSYENKVTRIEKAATIETAVASESEVVILVLPKRELPPIEDKTLESLKTRKVIGIGVGAGILFEKLQLEINHAAGAQGGPWQLMIEVGTSELLGKRNDLATLSIFREREDEENNPEKVFAMFLPRSNDKTKSVDAIARWTFDSNYAPIVRQGNHVLIGIPISPSRWSPPFCKLLREIAIAMCERPREGFRAMEFAQTKPGVYELTLANRGNKDLPFEKSFYFRFAQPVRMRVQLDHAGSSSVMMSFYGRDEKYPHFTRKDAFKGETLTISVEIQPEDIELLGDRYWELNITNFGITALSGQLTIDIEPLE